MRRRPGFTLMEVLVSIGLLLLLLVGGIAFSFPYLKREQMRTAGTLVVSELRQAQTDAYAQKDDTAHGVKVFVDRVVHFEGASYATRTTSKDLTTYFQAPVDAVAGVSEIDFATSSLLPGAGGTIELQRDGRAYQITISSYGVITAQEGTIAP